MDFKENEQRLKVMVRDLAQKHKASDDKLINKIAEWMAVEVERRKKLDHSEAANEIRQRLQNPLDVLAIGRLKLIVVTQERNDRDGSIREVYRLGPPVLQAFRELTRKTVKWGKNDRYWVAVKQKNHHRWLTGTRLKRFVPSEGCELIYLIIVAGPFRSMQGQVRRHTALPIVPLGEPPALSVWPHSGEGHHGT